MADLLGYGIAGLIGEGLKGFSDSYSAEKDRQKKQAMADDELQLRKRGQAREDFTAGLKWDPTAQSYSENSGSGLLSKPQQARIKQAEQELTDMTRNYQLLTPEQKEGTVDGQRMFREIQNRTKALSAMRNPSGFGGAEASGGLLSPKPQSPVATAGGVSMPQAKAAPAQGGGLMAPRPQVAKQYNIPPMLARDSSIASTEALGAIPSVPTDGSARPAPAQMDTPAAPAQPTENKGLLGGLRRTPGYTSKSEKAESEKSDALSAKLAEAYKNDMDPDRQRSGNFGAASARRMKAQGLQRLVGDYLNDPQKLNLDPRQTEELAISLASMLSGGNVASDSRVAGLVPPKTLSGGLPAIKEWFMNKPYGAEKQEFVKRMMDTVQRESDLADEQILNIQSKRDAAHATFKKRFPEQYTALARSYGMLDDDGKPRQVKPINAAGVDSTPAPTPSTGSQSKPKTVMQNGHTYILNESTGQYE